MTDMVANAVGLGGDWQGNKYSVKPMPAGFDPMGDSLDDATYRSMPDYFLAVEESDLCSKRCCGPQRGFTMHLRDASGAEVLRLERPFKCSCAYGCYPLCYDWCNAQEMVISTLAPGGMPGPKLGTIRQAGACFSLSNRLELLNAAGALIYVLDASCWECGPNCCCREFTFNVRFVGVACTGGTTCAACAQRRSAASAC